MLNNVVIQDTMEVYMKPIEGTKEYYFGITTKADIAKSIKQEFLKAGIGRGIKAVLQSDKEVKVTVANLLHCDDVFEIQEGAEFETGKTVKIHYSEEVVLSGGKLDLGSPELEGNAIVISPIGEQKTQSIVAGVITVADGVDGDKYKVIYNKEIASANVLPIDSKTFPKNYYVELHTIAYDTVKNVVVADIYYVFNRMLPDGNVDSSYEAGGTTQQEITLTALTPLNGTEYGQYIVVPRA